MLWTFTVYFKGLSGFGENSKTFAGVYLRVLKLETRLELLHDYSSI